MLEFNVNNQIIMRKDEFRVVADSRDYLKATFTLTDEWQGQVVAVFCHGDGVYHQTLSENCCMVPTEVIKAPGFTVSLFCEAQALVTANVIWVETEPSGLRNGTQPQPPTPDLWQQYMRKMSLMIESGLPYIGDNYHWFLFDPEKGDYEDTGIVARGEAPAKGVDYWTEEDKEEIVADVLASLPNADKMSFPLEKTISEVSEE